MNCDDVRGAIDAYALGALDAEDAGAVEAHLAVCPDCRRLVAEAGSAAHVLPLALASASLLVPPAELKARLVAAVAGTARTAPAPDHHPEEATQSSIARGMSAILPASRPEATRATEIRTLVDRGRWRWAAAAAAVLIVVASVAWSVRLSSALDRERATRDRVEAFYSRQQELVLEIVDTPKATRQILRPPTKGSDAYGKLFTRPDLPDVVVMVARLTAPSEGQTYHVWLTSGGTTVDAGVLVVDDQGFGLLTLKADLPGPSYDAVEVRLEPGGATTPNGTVVLQWDSSATDG